MHLPPAFAGSTPSMEERDGDGWLLAFGGARVRVEGAQTVRAEESTASPIVAGMHLGEHWVFVTDAGSVFRSDTALGPLSLVGTLEGSDLGALVSLNHRIALLDEDGVLFVGDADGMTRVETDAPVIDASFASPSFGARIGAGGDLHTTLDGGRSWARVTPPADAGTPTTVVDHAGSLFLVTSLERSFRIAPSGALTPVPEVVVEVNEHEALDEASRSRAALLANAVDRPASELSAGSHMVVFRGTALVLLPDDVELVLPPDAYGTEEATISFWGETVIYDGRGGLYRSDDGAPFTPFAAGFAGSRVFLDPESDRMAVQGPCTERDYDAGREPVVCIESRSSSHARPVAELEDVVGWSGGRVIVRVANTSGVYTLAMLDPDTGSILPLAIPDGVAVVGAHTAIDGTIWLTTAHDELLFVGAPDAPFVEILPPELDDETSGGEADGDETSDAELDEDDDASTDDAYTDDTYSDEAYADEPPRPDFDVVVLDRQHLIVSDRAHIWTSNDGGSSWELLEAEPGLEVDLERCRGRSCVLGVATWLPAGSSPLPHGRTVGSAGTPAPGSRDALQAQVVCDAPFRWAGHPLEAPMPDLRGPRDLLGAGWARIEGSTTAGWAEGAFRAQVGGIDATGPFSFRTARADIPPVPGIAEAPTAGVLTRLLGVTREVVVLERTRTDYAHQLGDLVVAGAHFAPRALPPFIDFAATFTSAPEVQDVLPLEDGSIAVRVSQSGGESTRRADLVFVVAPDGTFTHHTFESGVVSCERALAVDRRGLVGIVATREHRSDFIGIDGSVRALPALPERVAGICGAPQPDDLDVSHGTSVAVGPYGRAPAEIVVTLHADGSACLRRILTGSGSGHATILESDLARATLGAFATDGALEAATVSPDGRVGRASCRAVTARRPGYDVFLALGRLADGSLALDLAASYEAASTAVFRGGAWEASPSTGHESYGASGDLVDGASTPTAIVRTSGGEVYVFADGENVGSYGELGRVGSDVDLVTLVVADGSTSYRLVARDADETEIAGLDLGARTVPQARLRRDAAGVVSGAVVVCEDLCSLVAMEIRGATIHLGAEVPLDAAQYELPPWTLAWSGERAAVAVVVPGPSAEPSRIEVHAIDGATPVRIGPPIPASSTDVSPRALALTLEPRPRLVYVDGTSSSSGTHVRVVELRGGVWHDVAIPWAIEGSVAAAFDGDAVMVVSSAGGILPATASDGTVMAPASARLERGVWTPVPLDAVLRSADYEADAGYSDEEEEAEYNSYRYEEGPARHHALRWRPN